MSDLLFLPIYQSLPFFTRLLKSSLVVVVESVLEIQYLTLQMLYAEEGEVIKTSGQPLLFYTELVHIIYYMISYATFYS